jgi:phosphinothricin acetyltransferase
MNAAPPDASDDTLGAAVRLRAATVADAEGIRAIYNHEVAHTTATFDLVPRSLDEQRTWIAHRSGAFGAIVAVAAGRGGGADSGRDGGQIVGFAALSPYRERAAYRTTVEDSVYVDRAFGGRGVGSLLLTGVLSIARASGFHAVMARIEASGEASRRLHARCGFELIGIEREVGRKFNRWLDVAIMQHLIGN